MDLEEARRHLKRIDEYRQFVAAADEIKNKTLLKKSLPPEEVKIIDVEIKDLRTKLEASMKEWKEKLS